MGEKKKDGLEEGGEMGEMGFSRKKAGFAGRWLDEGGKKR
jgi:hypothetical protein